MERVCTLFHGHPYEPYLLEGFNTFLPPGKRIEPGKVVRVSESKLAVTCVRLL
jgi:histone deacetylase complex regulatory component SIN3